MLVDFSAASDIVQVLVLAPTGAIIGLPIVVFFKKCFKPLTELKIVLVLGLRELGDVDMTFDAILVESGLVHLVVFNKFVLVLSLPLHL